jgi:hypothetical protein
MILVNKQSYNTSIFTLREKSSLSFTTYPDRFYLFEFSYNNEVVKLFTADDISDYKNKFNKFIFIEKENEDLLDGKIYIQGNTKQLEYKVYESLTEYATVEDLLVSNTTEEILETGRVLINGSEQSTINNVYL